MGKIRVKTLGDEVLEKEERKDQKKRKEAKQTVAKTSQSEEYKEEEEEVEKKPQETASEEVNVEETEEPAKKEKKEFKNDKKAYHSQKYQTIVSLVDKTKSYSLNEALETLEKLQRKSFDETVELHINTASLGLSGNVVLPNGTGKKTRVAVANEALIAEIEKGIINFDILVSTPDLMPKLARVAKVLGPRGLMPNPKNGTITEKPEEVAKKYEGGQVNFKTEAKSPIIHLSIGKMSFGKEKLTQNVETLVQAIKKQNIVNATIKSTMSPGLKIKV